LVLGDDGGELAAVRMMVSGDVPTKHNCQR
jgi:hypothetical protein